jgi:nitrate/TMAO reductase-like tetraheme cytochrome c subunit
MKDLKHFCNTCQKMRDIDEIILERPSDNEQSEIIRMDCGHKHVRTKIKEKIILRDFIKAVHKDSSGKFLSKYKTKMSGETKRPARENLEIDRKSGKKIHLVWERNEEGEWELVHDEEVPLIIKN